MTSTDSRFIPWAILYNRRMSKKTVDLFRTKPIAVIQQEAEEKAHGLKRVLSVVDLTAIGVGAIIGAGIFVLTGTAAAEAAGPGIMLSYTFAGVICILAALCYAEFAAWLPISGSAYTYAYAGVGELVAWIIGWDLVLEYTIGSATVAVGWAGYLEKFLEGFGWALPDWLLKFPVGSFSANILAAGMIVLLSTLLAMGIKESARFNAAMVGLKLLVVLMVIFVGVPWVRPENWSPFLPFGVAGIFKGAALIFFAYIGFDAVSTAAEEVKNPQRDLPIGIIASLVICTVLYVLVSGVITGMVSYQAIDRAAPLAAAFGTVGMTWAQKVIGLGGVAGLTTVMLILLMSQPRIYYSMSRDGLLWPWFSKVHAKFRTPINATIVTGLIAGAMAAFAPMDDLHHMVSIGTLFAFAVVCGSVMICRYRTEENPGGSTFDVLWITAGLSVFSLGLHAFLGVKNWAMVSQSEGLYLAAGVVGLLATSFKAMNLFKQPARHIPKAFHCPWVPFVPIGGMFGSIFMMVNLPLEAWIRLFVWLALGMVIYAFYGRSHSKLANG